MERGSLDNDGRTEVKYRLVYRRRHKCVVEVGIRNYLMVAMGKKGSVSDTWV